MPSLPRIARPILAALCTVALAACGGGSSDGPATAAAPAVTLSVSQSAITAGQSLFVTWNSSGSSCTAGGAWSSTATLASSGTAEVFPTGSGAQNITVTCSSGGASNVSLAPITIGAASAFTQTLLVADQTGGTARVTDANLTDPWGIVFGPTTPVWVSNARSQTATLYGGDGVARATIVTFNDTDFRPTGVVWNGVATDFVVSSAGKTGAATFIFSGKGGRVGGWNSTVDATHAITMYSDTGGANYKGLTTAANGTANLLYVPDFKNRKVDVFNNAYVKQTTSATAFTFSDAAIPATYAPFNIQALPTGAGGAMQLYVAYAQRIAPANIDAQAGAGLGYVDVFDTNGQLLRSLVTAGGKLNAPWGLALAPSNFGSLSGALLVGNFGDGRINGYDPTTGRFLGTVNNAAGTAFTASGLWAIAFGNGASNQPLNTLFYAAGINGEVNGNYGRIDLGTTPPVLGTAPTVTQTLPASPLRTTVSLTATPTAPVAIAKVEFYYGTNSFTLIGSATAAPYTVSWDTTKVANGSYSVRAVATDNNGNVGSSAAATVTVTQ
jgi:uncharacterized protein (TIGR03118 family)